MTKKKFEACRQGRMPVDLEPRSAFGEVAEMGNGTIMDRDVRLSRMLPNRMDFADERFNLAAKRSRAFQPE
jgi:hypothetical protein